MSQSHQKLDLIFDRAISGGEIFQDRNLLRHDYMPATLPHREDQIERLASILAPSLSKDRVSNLFAYGKTGAGKTIVTRYVLERLQRKAKEHERPLIVTYVNCRLSGTNYRVLADLCRTLGRDVPFTGLAVGELLDRLKNALQAKKAAFLVVLDEIDALVKRNEDDSLLYELTRINEKLTDSWIGLIGISNDLHFKDFLDPRVLSSLGEEELIFKPYTSEELYDILRQRSELAFRPGTIEEGTLQLCAALAAGKHGNRRRLRGLQGTLLCWSGPIPDPAKGQRTIERAGHTRHSQRPGC